MRKIYMIPEADIIDIKLNGNLLAGSIGVDDDPTKPVDPKDSDAPDFDLEDEEDGLYW